MYEKYEQVDLEVKSQMYDCNSKLRVQTSVDEAEFRFYYYLERCNIVCLHLSISIISNK